MNRPKLFLIAVLLSSVSMTPEPVRAFAFDEAPIHASASSSRRVGAIKSIVIGGIFLLLALFALRRVLRASKESHGSDWLSLMPSHLKPERALAKRLEEVRARFKIEHPIFCIHIVGHPATTRRLQHMLYDQLQKKNPDADDQKILADLIRSRWESLAANEKDLFGLSALHFEKREQRVLEIASEARTVDGLVDLLLREEQRHGTPLHPLLVGISAPYFAEVDRILGEKSIK